MIMEMPAWAKAWGSELFVVCMSLVALGMTLLFCALAYDKICRLRNARLLRKQQEAKQTPEAGGLHEHQKVALPTSLTIQTQAGKTNRFISWLEVVTDIDTGTNQSLIENKIDNMSQEEKDRLIKYALDTPEMKFFNAIPITIILTGTLVREARDLYEEVPDDFDRLSLGANKIKARLAILSLLSGAEKLKADLDKEDFELCEDCEQSAISCTCDDDIDDLDEDDDGQCDECLEFYPRCTCEDDETWENIPERIKTRRAAAGLLFEASKAKDWTAEDYLNAKSNGVNKRELETLLSYLSDDEIRNLLNLTDERKQREKRINQRRAESKRNADIRRRSNNDWRSTDNHTFSDTSSSSYSSSHDTSYDSSPSCSSSSDSTCSF